MALPPAVAAARVTGLPNTVAVGIRVSDPTNAITELNSNPTIAEGDSIYLVWSVPLDGSARIDSIEGIGHTRATPWVRAIFRTPQPIGEHLNELSSELEELARLVEHNAVEGLVVQAVWEPAAGTVQADDFAFLIKRAAVLITGITPDAAVTAGPLILDADSLRELYANEVAAYLDLVVLAPGNGLEEAVEMVAELDPGKQIAVDGLPWPKNPSRTVVQAAYWFSRGISVTIFTKSHATAADLAPLKVMAREMRGKPLFDANATPTSPPGSMSFVSEDLNLRVIASTESAAEEFDLVFADKQLTAPSVVDLATGEVRPVYDVSRTRDGLSIRVRDSGEVVLLRLERTRSDEAQEFGDVVDVAGQHQISVEEILRRLQAFEDDQARRLSHYQATRTLHLRFQGLEGSFEASYSGESFFESREGLDWVWSEFLVGGVKWRSKKLPKVPLIQPEKVASLPAEIRLSKDYDYRLRGTATIDGRDCWVIDFEPSSQNLDRSFYEGTVWVDREIFARVRTRATQLGLRGSVLSNEETWIFSPIDEDGQPASWSSASSFLPLRNFGQQTLSILGATIPVEFETVLENVRINKVDFRSNRELARGSNATMLRDTDDGFRYLRKNENDERVVERVLDSDQLFLVGGVLWDETLDFPLPLAGVNYLNLDVKHTGTQLNVFFAGAFLSAGLADSDLLGGRFFGGANLSGLFVRSADELYRQGEVVPEEEVKRRTASADLFIGRSLGRFSSFELRYRLQAEDFSRAEDTAQGFLLPQDTLTHSAGASIQYSRAGYTLGLGGDNNRRSDWQMWGLPDNNEFRSDQENYLRWRADFSKTWWLSRFRRITLALEHVGGRDLDRFSGYDFGIFGDSTVSGYPSGLVRAEKASGIHLAAGRNYFEAIRFDFKADAVWASNSMTGLENELLAGVGIEGTVTLPWQLIMNLEVGYAVAGPGAGDIALRLFFLRLFPEH